MNGQPCLATDGSPVTVTLGHATTLPAAVVAWHGVVVNEGQPVLCSPEDVTALLRAAVHLRAQVERAMRRRAPLARISAAEQIPGDARD